MVADSLAGIGHGQQICVRRYADGQPKFCRVWTDGSHRDGSYAIGIHVEAADTEDLQWRAYLDAYGATQAESATMSELVAILTSMVLIATLLRGTELEDLQLSVGMHACTDVLLKLIRR